MVSEIIYVIIYIINIRVWKFSVSEPRDTERVKKLVIYGKFLYLHDVKSQTSIQKVDNGRNKDKQDIAEEKYWSIID